MNTFVNLNAQEHGHLCISPKAINKFVSEQHMLLLSATEITFAACDSPIFLNRNNQNGSWTISAICALKQGENLFMQQGSWQATYGPRTIATYPFQLVSSSEQENTLSIGLDPSHAAFSDQSGEALFDKNSQPSAYLQSVTSKLNEQAKDIANSYQFCEHLASLDLIKKVTLHVSYKEDHSDRIDGLYTINEDRLKTLSSAQLVELNQRGFLTPINALLMSLYQLNKLIKLHNVRHQSKQITAIKLEVSKA